jgi:tight adherence protein C
MVDILIEKFHDPQFMTMVLAAIAASATVYTLITPFFCG